MEVRKVQRSWAFVVLWAASLVGGGLVAFLIVAGTILGAPAYVLKQQMVWAAYAFPVVLIIARLLASDTVISIDFEDETKFLDQINETMKSLSPNSFTLNGRAGNTLSYKTQFGVGMTLQLDGKSATFSGPRGVMINVQKALENEGY